MLINHGDVVLEGNLKDIKKAYGKNRLVISFEEMPEDSTEVSEASSGPYGGNIRICTA